VFVADTGNGRVVKYSSDGTLISRWGGKGSGRGQLNEPVGIAIASDGRVFVADGGNQRIVILAPSGDWLGEWPVPGWKDQVYREPYLAMLPDDGVVASDPTGNRILVFDAKGTIRRSLSLPERTVPTGIAVVGDGRVAVSELEQNRIELLSVRTRE
jgi:sugar lactone lactonase YvrE